MAYMSGHSKWATTKRAKEAKDSKRSNLFTKLSKNITIAAKSGADPDANFKLRMAIDQARSMSMPKENIERAIKRGSGTGDEANLESLLYEAIVSGGVALLIEVLTDNRNRTISNIKHILTKAGASLGNAGSVQWMFDLKGEIGLAKSGLNSDEELQIIEAGAEDILTEDDTVKVITDASQLEQVKNKLQIAKFEIKSSAMIYLAKNKVIAPDPDALLKLLDALDDDDDVNNIYTNADI